MPQYYYTTQGTASQAYLVCTTYAKLYSLVMYVYGMHNCAGIERKFETEVGYLISRLLYTLYTHIHKASRPCLFSNKVALISIPRTTNMQCQDSIEVVRPPLVRSCHIGSTNGRSSISTAGKADTLAGPN